jgi:cytoskeletal protein RodZ
MPLKGHARNMVSSYARYLGLDSEELTKQFLSEYHDFENREARVNSRPLNYRPVSQNQIETNPLPVHRPGKPGETQGVRSMWDKPIPTSELNRGYDSRSSSAQRIADAASRRRAQTSDDRLSRRSGGSGGVVGSVVGGSGGMPRRSLPMRILDPVFRSPVVLVAVLVIIIVIALVIWALVTSNGGDAENTVVNPPINVDVPNNGSNTSGNTEGDNTPGEGTGDDSQYGPFTLMLEPDAGATPWVRVIVDDANVYEDLLSETKTWQVTASCEITVGQPDKLKVTRNGESVTLDISDGGIGSVTLEVQTRPANPEG